LRIVRKPIVKTPKSLLWLALTALPGLVQAQIYVCKDSAGRTISADHAIAECAARPMRELGNNGVTKREIPAPLTAEQKRQRQLEAERVQAEAELSMQQRRRDLAMLERFRNENEIEAARARALEDVQKNIKHEGMMLALAERRFKDAQTEAEHRKDKNGRPLLPTRQFEDAKTGVNVETELMRQQQINLSKVETWFDETLKRYRELVGSGLTP
jgi:hypothetical protein